MSSTPYDYLFTESSEKWGVPEAILKAIAWKESSMRPGIDPNPPRDGVGLMQMTEATARSLGYMGTREGLKDPAVNIDLGAQYVSRIADGQGGFNLADLYSEYNSGRAKLWETSQQVAANVAGFLKFFAAEVGVSIPDGLSIQQMLGIVGSLGGEAAGGVLLVLALVLYFARRR